MPIDPIRLPNTDFKWSNFFETANSIIDTSNLHEVYIEALQVETNALAANIGLLEDRILIVEGNTAILESGLSALDLRVVDVEANIVSLDLRIADIESNGAVANLSAIEDRLTDVEANVVSLDLRVIDLEAANLSSVAIGNTITLEPSELANVVNTGNASHLILDFYIPKGADGTTLKTDFSFVGDGVTTEFDLGVGAITNGSFIAWIEDGIWQQQGVDYNVSANNVVRTDPPANNAVIFGSILLSTLFSEDLSFDVATQWRGLLSNNCVMLQFPAVRSFEIPAGLVGTQTLVGTVPTANTYVKVSKNSTQIGQIDFYANGSFILSGNGAQLDPGDGLYIIGPVAADATFSDVSINILGSKI